MILIPPPILASLHTRSSRTNQTFYPALFEIAYFAQLFVTKRIIFFLLLLHWDVMWWLPLVAPLFYTVQSQNFSWAWCQQFRTGEKMLHVLECSKTLTDIRDCGVTPIHFMAVWVMHMLQQRQLEHLYLTQIVWWLKGDNQDEGNLCQN